MQTFYFALHVQFPYDRDGAFAVRTRDETAAHMLSASKLWREITRGEYARIKRVRALKRQRSGPTASQRIDPEKHNARTPLQTRRA